MNNEQLKEVLYKSLDNQFEKLREKNIEIIELKKEISDITSQQPILKLVR